MPIKPAQLGSPSFVQSLVNGQRQVRATLSQVSDTNIQSTGSFFYDPPGSGLKSTQQLNVDWSKFENHTFFNSAEVNVNVAFDRIINRFPFDGTKQELEKFFEGLTGFEKWIYDRFPKNTGYLWFKDDSYVSVAGLNGTEYPDLATDRTGQNVLDQGLRSFATEFHLYVPEESNASQVVFQKRADSTHGYSFVLNATSSTTHCEAYFIVQSGSAYVEASTTIPKGRFNHICAVMDRGPRKNMAQIFLDAKLTAESATAYTFGDLGTAASPLVIGSGSAFLLPMGALTAPFATLSGAMDEFRFFHGVRSAEQLKAYARKTYYPTPDLKLYLKFNEPYGSLVSTDEGSNGILIDSSGNELHTRVANFTYDMRATGSLASPMIYEKTQLNPVLFPGFTDLVTLNTTLLISATNYDDNNKNLITKLVPAHYFRDGKDFEGLDTVDGTIGDGYTDGTVPGTGKLGAAQVMMSFLYVWAKFFDEIKLYVDAFANVKHVDYNPHGTAPDNFLPILMKWYGFNVPSFFNDASIEQFIDAENIQPEFGTNEHALQYVQNQIHRRILVNLLDVLKSKGTLHSLKSFIRSVGIDPDNTFRIREFGGPTRRRLSDSREMKSEPHLVLDFRDRSGIVIAGPLSASRVEPGFPAPKGEMVRKQEFYPHGISNHEADGVFTSGSYSVEGIFRFPIGRRSTAYHASQSLFRLAVTGSHYTGSYGGHLTWLNVVATSGSQYLDEPTVKAYIRPGLLENILVLTVTGSNLFDGNRWNVSIGRHRNDEIESFSSSSYFLRIARQEDGEIEELYTTASYYGPQGTDVQGAAANSPTLLASASYLIIGNETIGSGPSVDFYALNDENVSPEARAGIFEGQVSRVRFWTKGLTQTEWEEHVRNYRSAGVEDPLTNYNFDRTASGSFQRLRIDATMEQADIYASSSGTINIFDYSQNNLHMRGTGFTAGRRVLQSDIFRYSYLSPLFDEAVTNNKVRVRSFQNYENVRRSSIAVVAPMYEPEPSEPPMDDTRFSIEFSIIDALNRDIITIFATLEDMDNALGSPELMFDDSYPGLERLRDIYFQRLTDKVNLKAFFEYFKWFDSSISSFITQLVPRKTKFYGTNFVIESHMLERAKVRYFHHDNYMGPQDRIASVRDILLQQLATRLKKF